MMTKNRNRSNSAASYLYTWLSLLLVISVCLFIIAVVFYYGFDVLSLHFLITEPNPSAINTEAGGILTPIIGTMLLTIIGSACSFPFALATAIYLSFYSKKGFFYTLVKSAIDILAGVPTIIVALFALAVFTQPFFSFLSTPVENAGVAARAYGKSFFVSGITMAIMILPFVIKAIEEAIKTVPESYIEGAMALGASKSRTISKIVLLDAKPGMITGLILGMGRIIGDTAIVWLTLGGTLRMTGIQPWFIPQNWLSALQNTGSTLTSYIYFTSPAGEGNNYSVAFGASLVLIFIIIFLNSITAILGAPRRRG